MAAGGGHAWLPGGACVAAGGACVAAGGVCVAAGGACVAAGGACVAAGGGMRGCWGGVRGCRGGHAWLPGGRAWLLGGVHGCFGGGVHGWSCDTHAPPVNRITDRCKNITFAQTTFAGGNKYVDENGTAAMLVAKRSAGVAPGVILGVSVAPQKMMSSKNYF